MGPVDDRWLAVGSGDVGGPELVIVSNRGPLSFSLDDNRQLVAKRGAGGLVSSLSPLVAGTDTIWIAAAMGEHDRIAAERGLMEVEGFRLQSLALDPDLYRMAYDVVSNATLWFLHHGLFDLARRPRIDRRWREAWSAYEQVNQAFADAVAETAPRGATVLVQDYHLALVGAGLARSRPDLRAVHFTHTPFCDPSGLRILPSAVAEELLASMAAHVSCGFHAPRWALAFEACCAEVLGLVPPTFVAPLGPDAEDLERTAASDECVRWGDWLTSLLGDRQLVLRVDRVELSKNVVRGFLAFDELLDTHPELRGRVTFVALVYASRQGLPEYLAYRTEVENVAARVNHRWATPDWTPIVLDVSDNYPRSVAALRRYDVLLVNPLRDGLNLVAKEGPVLNTNRGLLALSREAGAWAELSETALEVNPFDVTGTAEVMAAALTMAPAERAERSDAIRRDASRRTPRDWLDDQLAAAEASPNAGR
jgi:trehalose 6-phosphate synthase